MMKKCQFPLSLLLLLLLMLMLMLAAILSPTHSLAADNTYLSEKDGVELNLTYTETPPKRPLPKILNAAQYELKWKKGNHLDLNLVQDEQGVLYSADSNNTIHAIYPNGKEKWSLKLDPGFETLINLFLGQDGTLYAHTDDQLTVRGTSVIYAISPKGTINWKLDSNELISSHNYQFAGDARGNLYLFNEDGLVSLNAKGKINWVNTKFTSADPWDLTDEGLSISLFLDRSGHLYLNSDEGEVISVDSDGVERWRSGRLDFVHAFANFHPYFSDTGLIYFLTIDGLKALRTEDGSTVNLARTVDNADILSAGVPSDGRGGFYIGDQGRLFKINLNGVVLWEYIGRGSETQGLGYLDDLLTDPMGNLYFSTGAGNIIGLNSNGQEFFVFLRNAFWHKHVNLTLGKNGNIYSTSFDIGMLAFGKKQVQVYVDNLSLPLDVAPIKQNGTVLVPFRALFEHFGLDVKWDAATRKVTGTKEGLEIQLTALQKVAYVNGKPKPLLAAPVIQGGNTFVPLRFLGETLGKKVSWDGISSSVNIN
ncbi:stalk domain-containing protein [Paenibacillus sp. GCM10023252]|uniref:stalk domain-containing protein n=1 Tax=Paenibacillus sp. GCM10023252 TaxID=3252649 RepID=UPI00361B2BDE